MKDLRAARSISQAERREPANADGSDLGRQEKMHAIDHIMEILREGGYHCELLPEDLPKNPS